MLEGLFGPSKDTVWSALAAEVDGRFTEGGWFEASKVEVEVGEWLVTLDHYTRSTGKHSTTYTRLRAPYRNPRGVRFSVSPENFFHGIGKAFGMQDVQLGFPEFDARWIVQGNDEQALRRIFGSESVRSLLSAAGHVSFRVKDDDGWFGRKFPKDVDELVLTTRGIVKDTARLKVFFALFAETLDQLTRLGYASERNRGTR